MTRVRALLPFGLTVAFLFLTACDSGGANEAVENTFQLDVAPAVPSPSATSYQTASADDTTLNGYSFYYNPSASRTPGPDRNNFLLYLNENETLEDRRNQEGLLGFAQSLDGRPATGSYPLAPRSSDDFQNGDAFAFSLYYDYQKLASGDFNELTYYKVLDGTITFDVSDGSRVAGSVDATAEAVRIVLSDSTGYDTRRDTTTVTGTFTARNADTFLSAPTGSPGPGT